MSKEGCRFVRHSHYWHFPASAWAHVIRLRLSLATQALVSKIASKLAFFPPSPPSYLVKRHNDNGEEYIAPRSS